MRFELESKPPVTLVAGKGNVVLVHGWCYHPERKIRSLALGLGDAFRPAIAHSMPRPDLAANGGGPNAARSGFWGLVETGRLRAPERRALRLRAELEGGETAEAIAGEVEVVPSLPTDWSRETAPAPAYRHPPVVAICMPTYEPRHDLFEAQIASLRAQSHPGWYCVVCDDDSSPATLAMIEELVGDDERFSIRSHDRRLGFYRNAERALTYVSPEAELVALADQDDRWHPDKLAELIGALGPGRDVAYADMRVVDGDGGEIAPSYWAAVGRRNEHRDIATLIVSNTLTGANSIFRRTLLGSLLPFPEAPGPVFHDHWLALVGLATGEIGYVDHALSDHVRHGGNATDAIELGWRSDPRAVYANDLLMRAIFARVLELRCEASLSPRKRRALRRFASAGEGLRGLGGIAALGLSRKRRASTLGLERELLEALRWKRGAAAGPDGGPLPLLDRHGHPLGAAGATRSGSPGD